MSNGKMIHALLVLLVTGIAGLAWPVAASAELVLVKDGQPNAQIVVPEDVSSSVKLAASELQTYLKKISGAQLPITSKPGDDLPVKIYLGRSEATDRLSITDEGLLDGAFHIKSGKDWLVLLGRDRDFTPVGVWKTSRSSWNKPGGGQDQWDKLTNAYWVNPIGAGYPSYNKELDLWREDETGTLYATHELLRRLGVRWYMPGELGEIVPQMTTITLPDMDETVRPAMKLRMVNFARYPLAPLDDILWSIRLGTNLPFGYHTHHGLNWITRRDEAREAHPEWYALTGGERERGYKANACLSSEGLFQEHLRFLRFMFDMYDTPILSVWPSDGFTSLCQCELCKGKDTPERGSEGRFSDYVWGYVNRLAKELAKTHPDKLISCGAYSTYRLPPASIDKLEPNVVVRLVNGRRRWTISEEELAELREIRQTWEKISSHKVIFFTNFWYSNTPRLVAEEIKDIRDIAMGEDLWVSEQRGLAQPAFTHLNTYIAARLWWGIDQNLDDMLAEYYPAFYGPAAKEMETFINHWELNYRNMGPVGSAELIQESLDLYDKAVAAVDADTVYGKRVALFGEGLKNVRKRYVQIAKGRVDVPSARSYSITKYLDELKIDGRLDEGFWDNMSAGKLVEHKTGAAPKYATRFKFSVYKNFLYFGIRCEDEPGDPLNITATKNESEAIWAGDNVELLIETGSNSYYQLTFNPAGAMTDLDRAVVKTKWLDWSSKAEYAVHVDKEKGIWSVEGRIPFTTSTNDPLHEMIGTTPRENLPWFINVVRQRVRGDEKEMTAWSPSEAGFHDVLKFGKFSQR